MFKKLLIISLIVLLNSNLSFARDLSKDINQVLTNSNIKKGSISISIKDIENNNIGYELNSTVPRPPASIQKLITTLPAVEVLGENYKFETKLFKNKTGNYIIKLGADPYLNTNDLKVLTTKMPAEIKSVYIDDTIIDAKEWGEGWQWDDDINPLMPKFSAYNIDRNMINIFIEPTMKDAPANIVFEKDYPLILFLKRIIQFHL